eukprot:SAG31_NODE_9669_length_1243_cov_4.789336_2_plen_78_part_01
MEIEPNPLLNGAVNAAAPESSERTAIQRNSERVDTAALTGLRGLAALHVALGHYTSMSDLNLNLCGGVAMPFFYLLSG